MCSKPQDKGGAAGMLKQLRLNRFMVMWALCLHIHHFSAEGTIGKGGLFITDSFFPVTNAPR